MTYFSSVSRHLSALEGTWTFQEQRTRPVFGVILFSFSEKLHTFAELQYLNQKSSQILKTFQLYPLKAVQPKCVPATQSWNWPGITATAVLNSSHSRNTISSLFFSANKEKQEDVAGEESQLFSWIVRSKMREDPASLHALTLPRNHRYFS